MSNPKRKKRRNPIVKFIKIVVSMVLVFLTVSASAIFAYSRIVGFQEAEGKEPTQGSQMNIVDALMKKNIALNVAVFGVDADGTRTDVIFIVHFDSKSGNLKLMSVPRDTRVTISDTMYAYLKANNKYIPS
ncbi:MAG: LCP family protein, partial [Anaerotignaceae bacterium]